MSTTSPTPHLLPVASPQPPQHVIGQPAVVALRVRVAPVQEALRDVELEAVLLARGDEVGAPRRRRAVRGDPAQRLMILSGLCIWVEWGEVGRVPWGGYAGVFVVVGRWVGGWV